MTVAPFPGSEQQIEQFLDQYLNRGLLRFTTAGSVDDGKSTLIGRLLHDSKSVYEDQLASIRKSRVNRSGKALDLSLLTDGLKAEREQGITIDVAYRYFATPRRKFIIADTPGHEQYTRNMATGASTADLAVILIDASKGLLPQSRRHTYISALLGITQVVAAVNKMDLVNYDQDVFRQIENEFALLAGKLGLKSFSAIPISALEGDNVVTASERMPWYSGPTLMEFLETVPIPAVSEDAAPRFPVQYVSRPDASFRGFAGQVASGSFRAGDEVLALPSGQKTRIRSIVTYDGEIPAAFPPMSVTLQLQDEIDLSRGEMLVTLDRPPKISRHFEAMVVWMHPEPLQPGRTYLLKHTTRQVRGKAVAIRYRVNVDDMEEIPAGQLAMNDIGAVEVQTASPVFFDPYFENRATGGFILIDPISNATVGAGMIRTELDPVPLAMLSSGESEKREVSAEERYSRRGHLPFVILSERQTELSVQLERALFDSGFEVILLNEGDVRSDHVAEAVRALRLAGVITIYSGRNVNSDLKQRIRRSIPADQFLDLDKAVASAGGEVSAEKILASIQNLRFRRDSDGEVEWCI